jgi:hypothetical protein
MTLVNDTRAAKRCERLCLVLIGIEPMTSARMRELWRNRWRVSTIPISSALPNTAPT